MKSSDIERIDYLLDQDWTPLMISKELGIQFRFLSNHLTVHGKWPSKYEVAKKIRKATSDDVYYRNGPVE